VLLHDDFLAELLKTAGHEDDLEFSNLDRSARFVSGWWILPGLMWAVFAISIASIAYFAA